jgi:hypothetical protein
MSAPDETRESRRQKSLRLRCRTLTSVAEPEDAIQRLTSHRNQNPAPSIWKATVADIIDKAQRVPPH